MNIINKKKYKTDASRGGLNKNGAANKSHLHQTTPRSSNHEGSPDNGSSSSGTASTSSLTLSIINDNNNSNNNNLSPSSINNNSTTPTNTPDDQETINHLENECLKLTFEMNKIRKYKTFGTNRNISLCSGVQGEGGDNLQYFFLLKKKNCQILNISKDNLKRI